MNCYLVGSGNRGLNNPLNWSSTSGGTPADSLGSELITNAADREFSSDTGFWTKGTGVTITDGVCHFNNIPAYGASLKKVVTSSEKWLKINFTVLNYVSGSVLVWDQIVGATNIITNNGNYTVYLKTSGAVVFSTRVANAVFDIDNVSIKEVLCFPNSSNPIVIDANSSIANGDVLSITNTFDCAGFDFSAAAYTFTLSNAAYAFNVYGDIKDSVKRINGFSSTGYLYLKANCNIYSNGATQGWNRIYFDGVGATFTNQDDWNVGSTPFYLANGEWRINDRIVQSLEAFSVTSGSTRALTLTTGKLYVNNWNNANPSGFTHNIGNGTVICTGTGITILFQGGNENFYNLELQSPFTSVFNLAVSSITVLNNFIITGLNSSNVRLLIASNTIGTPRTITVNGSIVASNVDFRDITLAGTANRDLSAISGGSGDCGGNSGITFTPSQTQYYKHLGGGTCYFKDSTKWYSDTALTTQGRVPLPQDDWYGLAGSFNATTTFVVDCPRIGRSMDLSAVNQNVTWRLTNNIECYGSYVLGDNITHTHSNSSITLRGRSNYNINTYNKTLYSLFIDCDNGIYTNQSNINISYWLDIRSGTFDINDYDINNLSYFEQHGGTLYCGNGTIIINKYGNIVILSNNFFSENSSIIYDSPITANNIGIYILTNKPVNKLVLKGGVTGYFIINGNNTFNELVIEKGRKLQITGGSTQTIANTGKFIADGSPTEGITIGSTNTTPFNLVYAGTSYHQVNYCNISYCNATANRFYAGMNSVNGGNNTGWLFKNYRPAQNSIRTKMIKVV